MAQAQMAISKGARSKVWRHFEEVLLANDEHHALCILCKQMHRNRKFVVKDGGQVGSQVLRNHLREAHRQAWRDIDQEEWAEKEAKKKPELSCVPLWTLCRGMEHGMVKVKAALAMGKDVNSKCRRNQTGLMWAVINHQNSVVRLLLEQPTLDLNAISVTGFTALNFAVAFDNAEAARLLLADSRLTTANRKDNAGNTPVMTAIKTNKIKTFRELVGHPSIDLDARNEQGKSLEDIAR